MNRWKNWALTHKQSKASDYLILTLMLACLLLLLAGCSGTPSATPTPTPQYGGGATLQMLVEGDLQAAGVRLTIPFAQYEQMAKDTCANTTRYGDYYLGPLAKQTADRQVREMVRIGIKHYCPQYLKDWDQAVSANTN